MILSLLAVAALVNPASPMSASPTEQPVAPYSQSAANAGATPIAGDAVYKDLHQLPGIHRIVDDFVNRLTHDPRIQDIFRAADLVRLRRTLAEQICYISGGPCQYTGRDMKTAHANMGLQTRDFNALVEDLQDAMDAEGVPVNAQNRLLAKLAPMHRNVVAGAVSRH